jgi:predicted metal-dependent peptidase
VVENNNVKECDTARVSFAGHVYRLEINSDWVGTLKEKQQVAVIEHELGHIMLGHLFYVTGPLENVCADAIINGYLSHLPKTLVTPDDLILFALKKGSVKDIKPDDGLDAKLGQCLEQYGYQFLKRKYKKTDETVRYGDKHHVGYEHSFYCETKSITKLIRCLELLAGEPESKLLDLLEVFLKSRGKIVTMDMQKVGSDDGQLAKEIMKQASKKMAEGGFGVGTGSLGGKLQIENIWCDEKVPWDRELQHLLHLASERASFGTSWKKPNRRFGVLFAGTQSKPVLAIAAVVDTSGSVDAKMLSLVSFFLQQMTDSQVVKPNFPVIYCDAKVCGEEVFKGKFLNPKGGGGTDMQPGIILALEKYNPDFILVCTDGYVPPFKLNIDTNRLVWLVCASEYNSCPPIIENMPGKIIAVTGKKEKDF